MMDLGDQIGSLVPGKDADFVILSGDPFSIDTRVQQTWVEGNLALIWRTQAIDSLPKVASGKQRSESVHVLHQE